MLYTVVIFGENVYCSVVFVIIVGVSVFWVMWSELLLTQPTSGGAVTAVTICCENGVEVSHPLNGSQFTVFGQADHADPLDGWRSQKRVMSRLIQVRQLQTNESGFAISAINKYILGIKYL